MSAKPKPDAEREALINEAMAWALRDIRRAKSGVYLLKVRSGGDEAVVACDSLNMLMRLRDLSEAAR